MTYSRKWKPLQTYPQTLMNHAILQFQINIKNSSERALEQEAKWKIPSQQKHVFLVHQSMHAYPRTNVPLHQSWRHCHAPSHWSTLDWRFVTLDFNTRAAVICKLFLWPGGDPRKKHPSRWGPSVVVFQTLPHPSHMNMHMCMSREQGQKRFLVYCVLCQLLLRNICESFLIHVLMPFVIVAYSWLFVWIVYIARKKNRDNKILSDFKWQK